MSGLELGWIDLSPKHRDKVRNVIKLLSETGTMDEIGVGVVRDAFSEILFPGTTTVQTRAKYFLIVPYIFNDLVHKEVENPKALIESLHEKELELIDKKSLGEEQGIIGVSAGAALKIKPSDIYWNGIKRFGIFTKSGMSIPDYARAVFTIKNKYEKTKALGHIRDNEGELDTDDKDALKAELLSGFWKLPPDSRDWQKDLNIRLGYAEAAFLKERIVTTCPESLLAYVLSENLTDFLAIDDFTDMYALTPQLPDQLRTHCELAIQFARFIEGAHIRYNVILSRKEDQKAISRWNTWYEDASLYSAIDLNLVYLLIRSKALKLRYFLAEYQRHLKSGNIEELDRLIIERERDLKGDARARLLNAAKYKYERWIGIEKLHYRLKNAQTLCRDIFAGLD